VNFYYLGHFSSRHGVMFQKTSMSLITGVRPQIFEQLASITQFPLEANNAQLVNKFYSLRGN
jgi:hypothetical protein